MNRIAARGILFVLAFASLVGSSLLGLTGAGSRASAQGPALVLYGSIASGDQPLPSRVRATIGDVTCGSAEVSPTGEGVGFYAMIVVSSDSKPGCGVEGAAVRLALQSGEIDPGVGTTQILFRPGALLHLDLSTVPSVLAGSFVGALPTGPGRAYLRWSGPSGTPVEQALRTLNRDVQSVVYWDVARQQDRLYVIGADASTQTYTLLDTDDIVLVHVK